MQKYDVQQQSIYGTGVIGPQVSASRQWVMVSKKKEKPSTVSHFQFDHMWPMQWRTGKCC